MKTHECLCVCLWRILALHAVIEAEACMIQVVEVHIASYYRC